MKADDGRYQKLLDAANDVIEAINGTKEEFDSALLTLVRAKVELEVRDALNDGGHHAADNSHGS